MKSKIMIAMAVAVALTACNKDNDDGGGLIIDPAVSPVKVIDYSPAPGQFVNTIPAYTDGASTAHMTAAADASIAAGLPVTLGAWGGSITMAVTITNRQGSNDFQVTGNAITTGAEPGIIYVMTDVNGNGRPDDGDWLLIPPAGLSLPAGEISVTYALPADGASDQAYIAWTATDGTSGWLPRIPSYHTQSYFPQWLPRQSMTFTGIRLADNAVWDSDKLQWDLRPVAGTADSYPDTDARGAVSLDDVVDLQGNPVRVERIDFVKVVTGVLKANGMLGEVSTEVSGIKLLH